jgi:hypothetical protein
MTNYEELYIKEGKDKKPLRTNYDNTPDGQDIFEMDSGIWLVNFNKWLSARLERAGGIKDKALNLAHYWQDENSKDRQLYGLDEDRLQKMIKILKG